jgi:hypothetical protein
MEKIKCTNCGGTSCYICKVPNIGHDHFFQSGCPMFCNNVEEQEAEGKHIIVVMASNNRAR